MAEVYSDFDIKEPISVDQCLKINKLVHCDSMFNDENMKTCKGVNTETADILCTAGKMQLSNIKPLNSVFSRDTRFYYKRGHTPLTKAKNGLEITSTYFL